MDGKLREKKLQKLKADDTPVSSIKVPYKGDSSYMDVYKIPVEWLIFNQYNGRIGTRVQTHKKLVGPIDATTPEGEEKIIEFLNSSDVEKKKNAATQKSIEKEKQLVPGIVTRDGVIIDGNRRCMLIKTSEEIKSPKYFEAVILDTTLENEPQEIRKLETKFQMGTDDKLNYNPIEKYLKCRDLLNDINPKTKKAVKEAYKDIGTTMNEKSSEIENYLEILDLMDEFLEYLGYEGIYTYLEETDKEGPFVDLHSHLKRYRNNKAKVNWQIEKSDITTFKVIHFDYIRAGFGTHSGIRNIGVSTGFFPKEEIWKPFAKKHEEEIVPYTENQKSFEEYQKDYPDIPRNKLVMQRDFEWQEKVGTSDSKNSKLNENLKQHTSKLEDEKEKDEPLKLLDKAHSTLQKVNPEADAFNTDAKSIEDISHRIRKLTEDFIKITKKNN